ncbi:AAA family ATPase [Halotia wernerae UHCC 0503]|nr:AAA family ATPase [Halotia wernerae UHCC 0503]
MPASFPGYQIIEELHDSPNSLVYRGYQIEDSQPVILKILKPAYPSPERIAWFKQEYETTKSLLLKGVIKAYNLENYLHQWIMVLEDFGGESLNRFIKKRQFTLAEFLRLAIQIVKILKEVHQCQVIHKNINPANIVWNHQTGQVKLIDFSISTVLSRENPTFRNPNLLEGTLAYISPEQTGRMNRAIDYRTDFYSLGVTFYELLTGQLPFSTDDALKLVHCHIAKQSVPLHERKPDIPQVISEIVLKLMNKNAEDRYQSVHGLKADLEICLQQWQTKQRIEPFLLGRQDISDKFQIPQKLYGREEEIATLMAVFERVSLGANEMMLVSGFSGIGKSALVQEVYKPITRQHGYLIAGKFDQFQRNIPYTSIIQAFRSLVLQLLTENEIAIALWREKLLTALGSNGQVMIEVIPEVELIIGSQPAVVDLPPTEATNRFNLVLQNFIKVFTCQEHPLVIFLDDLQWVDGASLKLIEMLMTVADHKYLFLIGAYRDNEVSAAHPLMLTLAEIKKIKATVNQIVLSPLALPQITQLVSDVCHCQPAIAIPLAELVLAKTDGNPFFMTEFLKSLYGEALVTFNYEQSSWQWNLEQIQSQQITDNVVELMADKVQKLPPQTQTVLKLAACIGNQFSLERLSTISEKTPRETASALWSAIAEGFILPLSNTYKLTNQDVEGLLERLTAEYKFIHDRIQQAVYLLIAEADKKAVHLRIGQLLLKNTPPQKQDENLFDVVNQLNLGQDLINYQVEKYQLAQLNLQAGKKAKASAAYQSAFNYLQIGLGLLQKDSWHHQYNLTLELHVEAAEAAYLSTNFEVMERLTEIVLQQAQTLLEKVKVYKVRIQAYWAENKHLEAVKTALQVLKLLNIVFPEQPSPADIILTLKQTHLVLAGKAPSDLIDLPTMTDPVKLAAMQIMTIVWSPAYLTVNELIPLIACQQVNLSVTEGNAPESAFAYANYGLILCGQGHIDTAYQFSQLALHLLEKFNATKLKAKIYVFCNFVRHLKEHLRKVLLYELEAYQSGLESGDFEFAAGGAMGYCMMSYLSGKELVKLEQEQATYNQAIAQLKQEAFLNWHRIFWQVVLNLIGKAENPCCLNGEVYDENKMLPLHLEVQDRTAMLHLYTNKLTLCYHFHQFEQAIENAVKLEEYLVNAATTCFAPPAYFYDSLARLVMFPDASAIEQNRILEKVAANQEKMKTWANHAPMNYLHKFYLVEAERFYVLGKDQDAREYYDRAITLAHEHEYLHEEALAYELAGRFYLARNQKHLARHYLQDAHYAYQRWGAIAKVKDLETRYPRFLTKTSTDNFPTHLKISTTNSDQTTSSVLDFSSILKASQTISGEIVLDKLLAKLMKIVIENAGAQKGFLIFYKQDNLVIEAQGSVDADDLTLLQSLPVNSVIPETKIPLLSILIINYVAHTHKDVVLNDATNEAQFTLDPYIVATQPKSILCTPLIHQGKLSGILYLENNLTTGAFTSDRVEVLRILSAQAAISIENSRLYDQLEGYSHTLEQKVEIRTQELQQTNQELASTLQTLTTTQAQIIAQEKLASLGALTAGIAHEIKNPLNFVNNFAELSVELTQELCEEIANQQDRLDPETREYIAETLNDLKQNAEKINEHGKRADNIVHAMLMHSRGQAGDRQMTNINALLKEAIKLAYHGMRAKIPSFNISIKTDYADNLGQVNVVPQNISRAFINVINNACYTTHKKKMRFIASAAGDDEEFSPMLSVTTKDLDQRIEIRICDNGEGIAQEALDKIFNPFFTTKPTGEGTGLGLSITHDIIVQQHRGEIKVETKVNIYTDFIIILPRFIFQR